MPADSPQMGPGPVPPTSWLFARNCPVSAGRESMIHQYHLRLPEPRE